MGQNRANLSKTFTCHQKQKKMKNIKPKRQSLKTTPHDVYPSDKSASSPTEEKKDCVKSEKIQEESEEMVDIPYYTTADMKKKRRDEIMAKRAKVEAEREEFVKEMAKRKAVERAQIIKEARKLILYRKPMCRRINQALLLSECLRELDTQVGFQKTIEDMDKKQDTKYIDMLKEDVAKYEEEQKQKTEERLKKMRTYGAELRKQMEEIESNNKLKEKEELEAERQDQINMSKYLELIKEHEAEQLLNKKLKMQKFFKDAIEEKKQFDLKLKNEEEFEDRALEIYQKAKDRVKKLHKNVAFKEREEQERKAQLARERFKKTVKSVEATEEAILKKAVEELETAEKEKQEAEKNRKKAMRACMEKYKIELAAAKGKRIQEERDQKVWEMMQRFKRDEFDREVVKDEQKKEWNKKMEYANMLQKQIEENEAEREEERILEEKALDVKAIIEKENKKVLDYAEEVVEESTNVRPLYPILKAIEKCKKDMGLVPLKKAEEVSTDEKPKRKPKIRRTCTKFVPEDQICFL